MKNKTCLSLALAISFFTACDKSDLQPATPTPQSPVATDHVVKYDFAASTAAAYKLTYKKDSSLIDEIVNTSTWTKTVSVARTSTSKTARLSVYPPDAWFGTTITANINVKITVDGIVKKDTSGLLAGFDRTNGITIQTNF